MNSIIDMRSEVLIDRSRITDPYLRLLLTALGQEMAAGSPWVVLNMKVASRHKVLLQIIGRQLGHVAV